VTRASPTIAALTTRPKSSPTKVATAVGNVLVALAVTLGVLLPHNSQKQLITLR
jgi:hypothetical protein